jgi:hypothetical protein
VASSRTTTPAEMRMSPATTIKQLTNAEYARNDVVATAPRYFANTLAIEHVGLLQPPHFLW